MLSRLEYFLPVMNSQGISAPDRTTPCGGFKVHGGQILQISMNLLHQKFGKFIKSKK